MVSLLLVKGANVKALDKKDRTSLHLAAFMGELYSNILIDNATLYIRSSRLY